MKKLAALVLALILALAAIPALGEDYSGFWYLNTTGITAGSVELNADGTMIYTLVDEAVNGTWAATETGVALTVEDATLSLTPTENGLSNEEMGIYITREPEKLTVEMIQKYGEALLSGQTPELPEGVTEEEMMAVILQLMGTAQEGAPETVEEAAEAVEETIEQAAEETAAEAAGEAAAEAVESRPTMTHDEYIAAAVDDEVVVLTYVQATQAWWDNKITVYAQSPDGAYFIYEMACSEEDAAKLVPGTPIVVKGYRGEWSGEIEIVDATFVFPDDVTDPWIAEPNDVTAKLGTDELISCQNELVAFKGMTVEAYDESGAAFAYKKPEEKTDDLYFKVSKDGQTYEFCVEFYLCGQDTEVYKAVEALNVGDVVDLEGFLYWYEGANPHIIKVNKAE